MASKQTYIPLAEDDAVWIYETDDSNDLIELIANPFEWIKRICVGHGEERRQAVLMDNFVVNLDVSASETEAKAATYIIDGIDHTGVITVRMNSVGGRFSVKSDTDYEAIEEKILKMNPEFIFARAGDRCFVHLPIGQHQDLKKGLLAGAIENQDWLCNLYGKLKVTQVFEDGTKAEGPKLTFRTITNGGHGILSTETSKLSIMLQGSKDALETEDACNVGSGLIEDFVVLLDGTVVKIYAPAAG